MRLQNGSRVGPFEIVAPIGAGGMGEVYRARDTKLSRDVAIKVLPESVVHDPERLARFEREARVLAALNHPNIAQVHGFEESGGLPALVMELVEGATLAERLVDGPIALTEALDIARQIADALEAAHDQGIVHRDLKPANVKVRDDGTVKVLDFGLAKALGPGVSEASGATLTQSPTLAYGTQLGVILGTPAYMSPEQAKGKSVDKRADVWAFGCVLYEMLSGRRAFAGDGLTELIVSVVTTDPDWSALPPGTPPRLLELLRRCLAKESRDRLRDIGDARLWIQADMPSAITTAPPAPQRRSATAFAVVAVAGALIVAALVALQFIGSRQLAAPTRVVRFEITPPAREPFASSPPGINVAIAPDGASVAYHGDRGGTFALMLRRLDDIEAHAIPGSERGLNPFFSPDGSRIGFVINGQIRTVALDSGASTVVCDAPGAAVFAAWADDGTIVFQSGGRGLYRVAAGGGQPETLVKPDDVNMLGLGVETLPGGDVLYTALAPNDRRAPSKLMLLRKGQTAAKVVGEGLGGARYVTSGHLMFGQRGSLMAVPFDAGRGEVSGAPVEVQRGISSNIAVARNGTVLFMPPAASSPTSRLLMIGRDGKLSSEVTGDLEGPRHARISPDGKRIAIAVGPLNTAQVWVYDLARQAQPVKVSAALAADLPIWSPDGKAIAYSSRDPRKIGMYVGPADGTALESEAVVSNEFVPIPQGWSPDGATLLYQETRPRTGIDLLAYSTQTRTSKPWLETPFNEGEAAISTDGRDVAYVSDQTGRSEIWVRPFAGPGSPVRVSSDGGHEPRWSRDGRTVFFQSGTKMLAANVAQAGEPRVSPPRELFDGGFLTFLPGVTRTFDVAADGRFIVTQPQKPPAPVSLVVVLNLAAQLQRKN